MAAHARRLLPLREAADPQKEASGYARRVPRIELYFS